MSQKESEWEKEQEMHRDRYTRGIRFDWEKDNFCTAIVAEAMTFARTSRVGADASHITLKLRKLIDRAISNREKEIAEEVEKTYGKDGGPALVIIESHEGGVTQRPALNEVLQIVKH